MSPARLQPGTLMRFYPRTSCRDTACIFSRAAVFRAAAVISAACTPFAFGIGNPFF